MHLYVGREVACDGDLDSVGGHRALLEDVVDEDLLHLGHVGRSDRSEEDLSNTKGLQGFFGRFGPIKQVWRTTPFFL